MPFTDSDLRALQPKSKKYRVSAGDALFVEVYPYGGRYFMWRYWFPPGKEGKLRDYQIGPYGKGPGRWTLKQAREERERLEVLRRQGENPRFLKAEHRQSIQHIGAVTFEKAAEDWMASISGKLAGTTLKDYRNKLRNQILPIFGKRAISLINRSECLDFKRTIEARVTGTTSSDRMAMSPMFSLSIRPTCPTTASCSTMSSRHGKT